MATPARNIVKSAIQRLLRPIVALLLKNGVMYREFAAWAKDTYVAVAAADYGIRGRPTNQSRIALLTGLDRKQVKLLRDQQENAAQPDTVEATANRVASGRLGRVLSAWHQQAPFAADGKPLPLPIETGFLQLCRDFGGDVPASAILKELREAGAVRDLADGRVVATSRYYMPTQTDPAALLRSTGVVRDVCETVLHNLYREPDELPRFEGRATNLSIAAADADDFHRFLDERGQQFLEEVDAWLSARQRRPDDITNSLRLGVGLYGLQSTAEADDYE